MKKLFLILVCASVTGCMQNNSGNMSNAAMNNDSLRTALLNTDKSWNDAAQSAGFFHSRASFLADNAMELMEEQMPLDGKKAILDYTAGHPDSLHIKWTPLKAVVAASGDLGYTYGAWTMQSKTKTGSDTTMYGDYVTVWQKQADGSWKYVADTGNDTPHEVGK